MYMTLAWNFIPRTSKKDGIKCLQEPDAYQHFSWFFSYLHHNHVIMQSNVNVKTLRTILSFLSDISSHNMKNKIITKKIDRNFKPH